MSFIFAGLCFVYVGVIMFRKDFTIMKSTKELFKKMGWYNETIIANNDEEELKKILNNVIEEKIKDQKAKGVFMKKQKRVCKELKEKHKEKQSFLLDWFNTLRYYSGFEEQNDFVILSDDERGDSEESFLSEEECLLKEQ